MSSPKSVLFGFHAVTVRLKTHPGSVAESMQPIMQSDQHAPPMHA